MAALTALVRTEFDASVPQTLIQVPTSTTGDPFNFFRGALLYFDTGGDNKLTRANAADAIFAGVCDEQLVTDAFNSNGAVVDKLVFLITYGRMKVFSSICVAANLGKFLAATAGSDNPADLLVWNPGTTAGCVGVLDQVTGEGVSGYVNLSRRLSVTSIPT